MGTEREFGKRVSAALKQAGCAVYPIETGGTARGVPDLAVVHKGGLSLVELKCRNGTMLARIADLNVEGPGQRLFARQLAKRSAVSSSGIARSERSFLLVECMDGVALMVEEEKGAYLAACWESLPSGGDLRDALRAWRLMVMPSEDMLDDTVDDCYRKCAVVYGFSTGISLSVPPAMDGELPLAKAGGKEKALEIARDICDMGRLALLMESMKREEGERYFAPIEGDNGYVILSNGG